MNVERSHHVEVGGNLDADDCDISLSCRICDWHVWIEIPPRGDGPTLADLIDAADEHFDDRVGHP